MITYECVIERENEERVVKGKRGGDRERDKQCFRARAHALVIFVSVRM